MDYNGPSVNEREKTNYKHEKQKRQTSFAKGLFNHSKPLQNKCYNNMGESSKFPKSCTFENQILKLAVCL